MPSLVFSKTQRDLIKKLGVYSIILTIMSAFIIYLNSSVEEYEKKHKWLQNDISELHHKLDGFNAKSLEFSEAIGIWETLSEDDQKLQGLRINDAKDTLEKLQSKYKLSSVKTSFSKPDELTGDYKTDTVSVVSSIISITFNAISDESVYNFIGDITNNFPGYVQIKSLSVNRTTTITKEIIKKISMGEDVGLVSVTLDFYWHDLKYKTPVASTTPAGGTPTK